MIFKIIYHWNWIQFQLHLIVELTITVVDSYLDIEEDNSHITQKYKNHRSIPAMIAANADGIRNGKSKKGEAKTYLLLFSPVDLL